MKFRVNDQFFNVDSRGNAKPVKVGTILPQSQYDKLTPQKQAKCSEWHQPVAAKFQGNSEASVIRRLKGRRQYNLMDGLEYELHQTVLEVISERYTNVQLKQMGMGQIPLIRGVENKTLDKFPELNNRRVVDHDRSDSGDRENQVNIWASYALESEDEYNKVKNFIKSVV